MCESVGIFHGVVAEWSSYDCHEVSSVGGGSHNPLYVTTLNFFFDEPPHKGRCTMYDLVGDEGKFDGKSGRSSSAQLLLPWRSSSISQASLYSHPVFPPLRSLTACLSCGFAGCLGEV